jgi:hypothetical protein
MVFRVFLLRRDSNDENLSHFYNDAVIVLKSIRSVQNNSNYLNNGFNIL